MATSIELGMLSGDESTAMLHAHRTAGFAIGEPFVQGESTSFDFRGADLTSKVKAQSKVFATDRLVPPPTEVYSLHRRLAGAFSTCIKLEANIPCRDLLAQTFAKYHFGEGPAVREGK
jgi:aarF domain-containing kinase